MVTAVTLDDLLEQQRALYEEQEQIERDSDANGAMSDDQMDRYQAITDELDEIEPKIEKRQKLDAQVAANKKRRKKLSRGRQTSYDADAVIGVEHNFEKDPNRGYATPREFVADVMAVGQGRKKIEDDPRLSYLAAAGSDEQSGSDSGYGGVLVPTGFSPQMLSVTPEGNPMAGRTTMIPMENPVLNIPARTDKTHTTSVSGGLTVSRKPQTGAATSSRMEMENVGLHAHSLFGLAYSTEELLTDSPISFAAIIAAGFSDQFNGHLINERLNGTGVGEYNGIMNADCLVSVAKESGQAAATVVKENVFKMRSRCWGYGNAIWIANHDVMPELLDLNDSSNNIWNPSLADDRPDFLLGRPIFFSEYAKTLGTVGDLVLGNWAEYLEGELQPLQSDESMHVRFINHERTFKFWVRNAGVPWWRSALTPKNSTNTLSPFVVLATRA